MGSISDCGGNGMSAPEEPSRKLLEELCAKFILTAPKDALSKDKLFFLVEQAWWYYEDKVRPASSMNLKHYSSYTTFAEPLFRKCEALSPLRPNLQAYLEDYRRYKQSIPVYGAILLDAAMEQVLLVRGNKSSMGWGFPRGKVNEGESESDCAIREVLEETGYDIRSQLRENDFLEVTADGKRHKLYIVTGLDPVTQEFEPHSKWEIGAYAWHRVDALPATSDEASQVYMSPDGVRHRFFMIHPFVGRLRKWIDKRRRQQVNRQQQSGQPQPSSWSVCSSTASSLQMPLRELQQALSAPNLNPPAPATPAGPSGATHPVVSHSSITVPVALPQQQQPASQQQQQGRKEHKSSRTAQSAAAGPSASPPQQQHAPKQVARASSQQQQLLLQHVQQKLGQLQVQQQQQAPQGFSPNGTVEPTMSNFRFERGSIMGCFAAVA
ncbi:hypothetical protein PLESTB_000728500 [Pleodorina starrii]|uniref:Nudix hydrolase domain-containing protein n=1 Tax=Pleodorina starrii TaxID=330485 RepID=A0A9W6BKK6_9CHLO|nr:hypothetical protein PLESTM_000195500 [Pleodorina starrii]GLC53287.1 hypothetical protein PLESTB_000728500 [Pleodorina starrii]